MRIHAAIQLITLLSLMGSSMGGVFTPILSSFLAKMMNAARLVRYFQAQGCRSFLFRGYPGKVHVHVIMEVKEDKVEKFLKLIPEFLVATQVNCSFCQAEFHYCLSLEKWWLYLQRAIQGNRHQHIHHDRGLGVG